MLASSVPDQGMGPVVCAEPVTLPYTRSRHAGEPFQAVTEHKHVYHARLHAGSPTCPAAWWTALTPSYPP